MRAQREGYDEIVVNESIAYDCLSFGEVSGKKINSYEDILGLERSGLKIVGIADARFDKYDGEYKNATNQDFLNADEITQYYMKEAKKSLEENIESQINFVKEGYSEYTRNTRDSINVGVREYQISMKGLVMPPSYFDTHDGQEYYDISGKKTTAMLAENEIVISSEAWTQYRLGIGTPTEPFESTFVVGKLSNRTLKVVGYSDKMYVGAITAEKLKNTEANIYNALAVSSKLKAGDRTEIDKVFDKITKTRHEYSAMTPFTKDLHETASTLSDFNVLLTVAFVVSVVLLVLFNFFSVYVIMKHRKKDILTMRSINVSEGALGLTYGVAFGSLGLLQIIISIVVYVGVVFGINSLVKNTSIVFFDLIFVEALPCVLISIVSVLLVVLIPLRYLSVLYSKTIGDRLKR